MHRSTQSLQWIVDSVLHMPNRQVIFFGTKIEKIQIHCKRSDYHFNFNFKLINHASKESEKDCWARTSQLQLVPRTCWNTDFLCTLAQVTVFRFSEHQSVKYVKQEKCFTLHTSPIIYWSIFY